MNYTLIKRAIVIALAVGTLLNIINQYDAIIGSIGINWLKAGLTYVVPFCVSLLSSWLTRRDAKAQRR